MAPALTSSYQLPITLIYYKSFDDGWEVRGVFLDVLKAFHKVWHEGWLLKLKLNGIAGNSLKIMEYFSGKTLF